MHFPYFNFQIFKLIQNYIPTKYWTAEHFKQLGSKLLQILHNLPSAAILLIYFIVIVFRRIK